VVVGGRKVEVWSREGGVREWTRRATVGLQRGARTPRMHGTSSCCILQQVMQHPPEAEQ
jgi:hypothetical protein